MLIPNSTIILRAGNGGCSVKQQPAYFAKAYAILWRRKLLDEKGIEVLPMDPTLPESARYTEVANVEQAERMLQTYFSNTTSAKDPENDKNAKQARDLIGMVFPEGLRKEIAQLLKEDAERMIAFQAKPKIDAHPHPSFIEAGASADEALAIQRAGYPTLSELPEDLVEVCTASGLTPPKAAKLIATRKAIMDAEEKAAQPMPKSKPPV